MNYMMTSFFKFLLQLLHDNRGSISLAGGDGGEPSPEGGNGDPGQPPIGEPGESDPSPADPDPSLSGDKSKADFLSGLEDDVKNDPSLKVFVDKDGNFNANNLIKSYVHAQKRMGEKGVQLPGKNSSDEDWANFYNQVRDPDPEKYELKNSLPEGQALDEQMFGQFKELAHSNGLTPKQAQGILDWYNESTLQATGSMQEQQKAQYEEELKGLKSDWGDAFSREVGIAQRALKEFADEGTIKYLKESGLDSNVTLVRLFNKIGKGMSEEKFTDEGKGHFGTTKDEAQQQMNKMFADQEGAYYNNQHPSHNDAVKEMSRLMEIVHGQ